MSHLNASGKQLIKDYEGISLTAYQDAVGIWTIGYGMTHYPDGTAVKQGDVITEQQADNDFSVLADQFAAQVNPLIHSSVNDNQFSALVSFTYNLGTGALSTSTLLKKVNADPDDPTIRDEFMKWVYAGGVKLQGLVNRRDSEADLYFTPPSFLQQLSGSPGAIVLTIIGVLLVVVMGFFLTNLFKNLA